MIPGEYRSSNDENSVRQPKQARSREKHERLMDAGEKLIAKRGYDGTRVADIARAAGCAVGTFYHRFGDKEVFFRELQLRLYERGRAASDRVFCPNRIRDLDAQQLVSLFVEISIAGVRRDAGLLRAMTLRLSDAPELRAPMQDLVRYMSKKLALALAERVDEIDHPDPSAAVATGCQFMMGTLFNILLTDPGPLALDDDSLPQELTRMLTAYLGIESWQA